MTTARQGLRTRTATASRRPLADRIAEAGDRAYWQRHGYTRHASRAHEAQTTADHIAQVVRTEALPRSRRPLLVAAARYATLAAAYRRLERAKAAAKVARETAWAQYAANPYDQARYDAYLAATLGTPTLGGAWEAARVYGRLRIRGYGRAIAAYGFRMQRQARLNDLNGRTA